MILFESHKENPPTKKYDMMQHRYSGFECNETDRKASQPDVIKIQLKPHQLTSIAKMASMEAGRIAYDLPNGSYEVDAVSIGILADKAGYGKTMTTLGLVASNQDIVVQKSVVQSSFSLDIGQALCIRKDNNYVETYSRPLPGRDSDSGQTRDRFRAMVKSDRPKHINDLLADRESSPHRNEQS